MLSEVGAGAARVAFVLVATIGLVAVGATLRLRSHLEGSASGELVLSPVLVDRELPPFALPAFDGRSWTAAALGEGLTLLHLWATWCPPCIEELPALAQLQRQLGPRGLRVLSVSVDEDHEVLRDFLAARRVPFPVLLDPQREFAQALGTTKYPESFLVGRGGRITHLFVGPKAWAHDGALAFLDALLALEHQERP